MKYLILIHSNPLSREMWASFTAEQKHEGLAAYAAFDEELHASGELVISAPLADISQAKRITVVDGEVMTTDGPFAEVKEHLAGFILVECDGIERAVEIAAQVPEADLGLVEVRPLIGLNDMEEPPF